MIPKFSQINQTKTAVFITLIWEKFGQPSSLQDSFSWLDLHFIFFFSFLVFPFGLVSIWATAMAFQSPDTFCLADDLQLRSNSSAITCQGKNQTCWEGYTEQPLTYILSIPMTIALAVRKDYFHFCSILLPRYYIFVPEINFFTENFSVWHVVHF